MALDGETIEALLERFKIQVFYHEGEYMPSRWHARIENKLGTGKTPREAIYHAIVEFEKDTTKTKREPI